MLNLSAVDWILLAVLGLSFLLGVWRGVVKELLSLAGWVAAFYLAQMYAPRTAAWLPMEGSSEMLRYAAGFVITFIAVWATTHGLPSGTWLTLLVNCLINKAITALTLYRNKPDCTVRDIFNVVDYVMGDDKVFGAPAGYETFFNLKTINQVAMSLGMTCTNGDKTPITKEHQPLDKLTFVKRHMRKHPQLERIVGVLSLETILNTLQWYDSGFYIQFNPIFNVYSLNAMTQNMGNNRYWVPYPGSWNFLHGIFHTIKVPISISIDEPYIPILNTIIDR